MWESGLVWLSLYSFHCILVLNYIYSGLYFNQIVFLCTDHRFIPAFFMLKSLIGFFSLNKAFIIIIIIKVGHI